VNKELKKIAKTTLILLEKKSLDSINIDFVFKKAGVNNKNIRKNFDKKIMLLTNINRYIDSRLKDLGKNIENSNPKDMLFEIIMLRFDVLQEYRSSIINIFNYFKKNPKNSLVILPSFLESMILISKLSKIKTNGLKGNLKIKGILIIYLSTFLVWLKDKGQSMEKTMTSLDQYLEKASKIINIVKT
jgi:ubiquinone biosynthesis protein COQ9